MDYGRPINLEADTTKNSDSFLSSQPVSSERDQQGIGNRAIGALETPYSYASTPDSASSEISPSMPPGYVTESAPEPSAKSLEVEFSDIFENGSLRSNGVKQIKDEIRAASDSGDIAGLLDKVSAYREEYVRETKEGGK